MISITVNGTEASIEDMQWSCSNPALLELLEQYADPENTLLYPVLSPTSPSEPWADMAVVTRLSQDHNVQIISQTNQPAQKKGRVY